MKLKISWTVEVKEEDGALLLLKKYAEEFLVQAKEQIPEYLHGDAQIMRNGHEVEVIYKN